MMQVNCGPVCYNVSLVALFPSGQVAFVKTGIVGVVLDTPEDKNLLSAVFDEDSFSIAGEDYQYNNAYAYKQLPNMLQWLQQQKLMMPEGLI